MISVLNCIRSEHNPWLVLLAALICCTGSFGTTRLVRAAMSASGVVKAAWIFVASLVLGTAIWTTHFVAILAFVARAQVHYDPAITIMSFFIAVFGSMAAFAIAAADRGLGVKAIGGVVLGGTIAAVHYVGMLAYRIDGIIHWRSDLLIASIVLAALISVSAMIALHGRLGGRLGIGLAPWLLVAAIASLHFTGMAAMIIIPLGRTYYGLSEGSPAMALAAALAAALIFVAGSLIYVIDTRARQQNEAALARALRTDDLTGLATGAAFIDELGDRLASLPASMKLGVIKIELAGIEDAEGMLGTGAAAKLMQVMARRLNDARAPTAFIPAGSLGQFFAADLVLDRGEMFGRLQRLYMLLSQRAVIEGREFPLDLRIGAAIYPDDACTPEQVLALARAALSRALADPLSPIILHDEAESAALDRRIELARDLHQALEWDEFTLHYQPQVQARSRQRIGFEALLRWNHPRLGLVSPAEFIPLAEKTGLIVAIGNWALRQACREAVEWGDDLHIAVNVSPMQLRHPGIVEQIRFALADSELDPARLEIEITETLLIDDRPAALEILNRIRALGVRLALDDFGTGYSSMDVLRHFPFDKVKLDRSFVAEIEKGPEARAILHAMLTLGRELNIPVLVEGVETEHQLAILQQEGCDSVQGYLTGVPMPAFEIGHEPISRLSA